MPITSGSLGGYTSGIANIPTLIFYEWDVSSKYSPTYTRAIASGHPAFIKSLGYTDAKAMQIDDVVIDFGDSSLSGTYQSKVQCFSFVPSTNLYVVGNLKFWADQLSALNSSGHLEYTASGAWIPNAVLPSGAGNIVPSSLPTNQNVFRTDGSTTLETYDDYSSSQFVYMSLTVQSGMPLGQYGLNTRGRLDFKVTYDWYYRLATSAQTV